MSITNPDFIIQRFSEATEMRIQRGNPYPDPEKSSYWKGVEDTYHTLWREAFQEGVDEETAALARLVMERGIQYDEALNKIKQQYHV